MGWEVQRKETAVGSGREKRLEVQRDETASVESRDRKCREKRQPV
jgi:hypothetical protein